MVTVGTGKYTYELVEDWDKLLNLIKKLPQKVVRRAHHERVGG